MVEVRFGNCRESSIWAEGEYGSDELVECWGDGVALCGDTERGTQKEGER